MEILSLSECVVFLHQNETPFLLFYNRSQYGISGCCCTRNERTQTTWPTVLPVRQLGSIFLCMRASFLHVNTACGFLLKCLTMLILSQALGAIHPPPSRYATTDGVFRAKLDKSITLDNYKTSHWCYFIINL
jgi:hypothetical protein